ncbi:MAG: discoidin domain-containing protein, partial [Kiritimatiellae bacterium]|nr:discoidin domain-containing protein [Kiritimatiellia bacterium]
MKRFVCVFAVAAGVAVRSDALMYTTERLNDFAVRGGNGQIFVYGTDGAYGDDPSLTKEAVFDGNTETFFDPPSSAVSGPCWAGFELETPKMITRVRFYPRATYPDRLVGCLIQGANTPDFSDAVTLHTITAAHANTWGDETMTTPESLQAFKYVRIYGPAAYTGTSTVNGTCCGNAAEIEFYGSDLPGTEMTFPDLPEIGFADVMNGHMNFRIATVENTLIYQIQRKLADEPDSAFADHLNIGHAGTVARYFRYDPTPLSAPTVYRVRALNTVGASEWVEIPITPRSFLAGTWIGVAGSWGNSGATGDKVFDGNIATFYDPVDGNGGWTGYDFGEERTITGLAYMPRENYGNRMLGGTFQYASRPDFADARVFFTVTDTPGYDAITFVDLVEPVTARYVRFQSASDVWCNAAEIEWRPPVTELEAPPPLTVSISDVEQQNAVLTWELPAPRIPCDTIAILKGKGPGGPWIDISPEDISLTTTTFTDTGIVGYAGWYYTLAYRKTVDGVTYTGPVSEPVFFRRGHRLDVTVVSGFFQNGMSGLTDGSPYQGNSALGPAAMFDGNTSTF